MSKRFLGGLLTCTILLSTAVNGSAAGNEKTLTPYQFVNSDKYFVSSYDDGYCMITTDNGYGIMKTDRQGTIVVPPKYSAVSEIDGKYFEAHIADPNGDYITLYNNKGQQVTPDRKYRQYTGIDLGDKIGYRHEDDFDVMDLVDVQTGTVKENLDWRKIREDYFQDEDVLYVRGLGQTQLYNCMVSTGYKLMNKHGRVLLTNTEDEYSNGFVYRTGESGKGFIENSIVNSATSETELTLYQYTNGKLKKVYFDCYSTDTEYISICGAYIVRSDNLGGKIKIFDFNKRLIADLSDKDVSFDYLPEIGYYVYIDNQNHFTLLISPDGKTKYRVNDTPAVACSGFKTFTGDKILVMHEISLSNQRYYKISV